jgi:hypothetical protein
VTESVGDSEQRGGASDVDGDRKIAAHVLAG